MGSSKKVTVSYWYKLIAHFGFAKGPVDAMLEWRGGDRVIWKGRQETSGIISVNKPDLYGGESAEGGVVGDFELMMGEVGQAPNSYLAGIFGALQSAYRGRLTGVLRGAKIGAGNPYPKAMAWKFVRALKGWDDDVCWYPEKAAVTLSSTTVNYDDVWKYKVEAPGSGASYSSPSYDDSAWLEGQGGFGSYDPPGEFVSNTFVGGLVGRSIWLRKNLIGAAGDVILNLYHDDGVQVWWNGSLLTLTYVSYFESTVVVPGASVTGDDTLAVKVTDGVPGGSANIFAGVKVSNPQRSLIGMNPAHILYDSITSRKENGGMGEPTGRINTASFTAAADKAFAEGFGLCTTWKGGESAEQFQQRICNVAGWCMSQDILDGQYYIDMLRGEYTLGTLPIITDDDIIEWKAEPNSLTEAINHLSVAWFDPEKVESRVTTPIQSLGAIEGAGGVIPDVREYYEIAYEPLALRVADRDLRAGATPYWRFQLLCNRRALALRRPGRYFRLMAPKRGFADMVCLVSEIGFGNFANGAIQVSAIQDVISLSDAVFVDPQGSLDEPPNGVALPSPATVAIESPYVELASALAPADLAALTEDSGYLQLGAVRPTGSINYAVATALVGDEYEVGENADWTPSALLAETLLAGVPDTTIAYTNGSQLENVVIGTWALWGDEIVRVDDIDDGTEIMTLARACADTTPTSHAANERIWFIGDWYGKDSKEYVTAEVVQAKALTRTGADQLLPASAPTATVTMDGRAARPYPPGKLRITDDLLSNVAYPSAAQGTLTVTWAHRDRVLQADQLVPEGDASVGPEAGTTYTVRYYLDAVLVHTESAITGAAATPHLLASSGLVRVEVESVRDGLTSWMAASAQFNYTRLDNRITDAGDNRITDSGDRRATD